MAWSGWRRGFVFYSIDLVGFIGSVVAAVRFHEVPATIIDPFGFSPRTANVIGGLIIFIPLIVITASLGSKAARAMYKPGLFTLNRVLGAAFAAALALTMVVVALLFVRSAALPFAGLVKESAIAPAVLSSAAPGVAFVDDTLGLELCGGRLARVMPEVCEADDPRESKRDRGPKRTPKTTPKRTP